MHLMRNPIFQVFENNNFGMEKAHQVPDYKKQRFPTDHKDKKELPSVKARVKLYCFYSLVTV